MTPDTAAGRLAVALRPGATITGSPGGFLACNALAIYTQFAREVTAEAGPDVLAGIVRTVERHERITRGAA